MPQEMSDEEKAARRLPMNVSYDVDGNEIQPDDNSTLRAVNVPSGYNLKAKLHPDLVEHLQDGWVRHPYVVQVYAPEIAHAINMEYEGAKKRLAEAEKDHDFYEWVFAHARAYRLRAMFELMERAIIPDEEYWPLVAELWVDLELPSTRISQMDRS